jgi:hypothetical protein
MSIPGVWPQVLDFFGTPLVIEPSPGQLSGDSGGKGGCVSVASPGRSYVTNGLVPLGGCLATRALNNPG